MAEQLTVGLARLFVAYE